MAASDGCGGPFLVAQECAPCLIASIGLARVRNVDIRGDHETGTGAKADGNQGIGRESGEAAAEWARAERAEASGDSVRAAAPVQRAWKLECWTLAFRSTPGNSCRLAARSSTL